MKKRAPASTLTLWALLRRFNGPSVPLELISKEFFGMSPRVAADRAALNQLPVPTFRLTASAKAPLMVRVEDLAALVDERHAAAVPDWEKSQV
jgi:hypothetical protein